MLRLEVAGGGSIGFHQNLSLKNAGSSFEEWSNGTMDMIMSALVSKQMKDWQIQRTS